MTTFSLTTPSFMLLQSSGKPLKWRHSFSPLIFIFSSLEQENLCHITLVNLVAGDKKQFIFLSAPGSYFWFYI